MAQRQRHTVVYFLLLGEPDKGGGTINSTRSLVRGTIRVNGKYNDEDLCSYSRVLEDNNLNVKETIDDAVVNKTVDDFEVLMTRLKYFEKGRHSFSRSWIR